MYGIVLYRLKDGSIARGIAKPIKRMNNHVSFLQLLSQSEVLLFLISASM